MTRRAAGKIMYPMKYQDPSAKQPTSGRTARLVSGCGGCGCLFGLVAMIAGAAMLAWGATDSKVEELVAPGALVLVLAVVAGFFGAALLGGGLYALSRARKAGQADRPDQAPGNAPPAAPPGTPPPGPPPSW